MKLVGMPLLPPIVPDRSLYAKELSGAIDRVTHKMTRVKRRKSLSNQPRLYAPSACSRSAIRSARSSIPT